MKAYEIMNEIRIIQNRDYAPNKKDLEQVLLDKMHGQMLLSKLPGDNDYLYSIMYINSNTGMLITIWDPNYSGLEIDVKKRPNFYSKLKEKLGKIPGSIVGQMELEHAKFPINNAYYVSSVASIREYRGQKIGLSLYGIAMTKLNLVLVSDTIQTPKGAKIWNYLYSIPNVDVRGYVRLYDRQVDDEVIDILMSKLGAEYIGKKTDFYNRPLHYFAFDVVPHTTDNELTAEINTELSVLYRNSEIYSKDGEFKYKIHPRDVGLYATLDI